MQATYGPLSASAVKARIKLPAGLSLSKFLNRRTLLGAATALSISGAYLAIHGANQKLAMAQAETASLAESLSVQTAQLDDLRRQLKKLSSQLATTTQQVVVASEQAAVASEQAAAANQLEQENRQISYALQITPSMVPVHGGFQSTAFGLRDVHPVSGRVNVPHAGMDLACARGSVVMSTAQGVVAFAGVRGGYGNCVIVQHSDNYETLYGHLSSISVKQGQQVAKGQPVGRVGSTGASTGNHLHYEVHKNGTPVDPTPYLMPETALTQL